VHAVCTDGYQLIRPCRHFTAYQYSLDRLGTASRKCHSLSQKFPAYRCQSAVHDFRPHPNAIGIIHRLFLPFVLTLHHPSSNRTSLHTTAAQTAILFIHLRKVAHTDSPIGTTFGTYSAGYTLPGL